MARKKKVEPTQEELQEQYLQRELNDLRKNLYLIPEPTTVLKIGDEVTIGALQDVVIFEVLEDGKIYGIDFTSIRTNYGSPIRNEHQKRYVKWLDVRKKNDNTTSLIRNNDIRLSYSQRHLGDLLSKTYSFGVDFEPEYQREFVWDIEDKINLIDSIFNSVDIGKFVFIKNDYSDDLLYQVLDGKQRMSAILDYYEDRFQYKGYFFSELSVRDQDYFEDYSISIAEVSDLNREQILRYFIKLNTGGRIMAPEQIEKVRKMLDETK
jgi:hypothetical protein